MFRPNRLTCILVSALLLILAVFDMTHFPEPSSGIILGLCVIGELCLIILRIFG